MILSEEKMFAFQISIPVVEACSQSFSSHIEFAEERNKKT